MSNFQNLIQSIVDDKENHPVSIDPKMVEYAKYVNQPKKEIDYSKAPEMLLHHLNSITKKSDREFEFNEFNRPILNALFYYFTKDSKFQKYTEGYSEIFINRQSLSKGILIIGGYGTGKSTIVTAFQRVSFPDMCFKAMTCPTVVNGWNDRDINTLVKNNWFFDELGVEGDVKYSRKDDRPVMSGILEERYFNKTFSHGKSNFTILTTNLTPTEIALKYGERVGDRLREQFNIMVLKGKSFRD